MNVASGCTLAKTFFDGRFYCQLQNLICPTQRTFPEEEMAVECCCENAHLCNHDIYSYRAFQQLPQYIAVCLAFSSYHLIIN